MTDQQNPMEGKPAGWYPDPSGVHEHLAWWDGEKWTGVTADPGRSRKKASFGRIILLYGLAVIGLSILALIVVSLGGEEVSETLAELQQSLDEDGSSQGESADDWATHIDESLGFEISYPNEWQILDHSDLEGTGLSLAEPEEVADVFESGEASTSSIMVFVMVRNSAGSQQRAALYASRDDRTVEELTAAQPRDPGYESDREVAVAGRRGLLVYYDYGEDRRLLRTFAFADGILWSVACTFSEKSVSFAHDIEICETIATSFHLTDS